MSDGISRAVRTSLEPASSLPVSPDDPVLEGWYHTVELGNGLVSRGIFDHRPIIHNWGLPPSLRGKSVLDVGTADGFLAFEAERRGASRVVAIDVARYGDFDWLPHVRTRIGPRMDTEMAARFRIAHAMRGSRVEHFTCSVYDLSPASLGCFDVVLCGSLLLHLQNPLRAVVNIRAVTTEMAVIETVIDDEIDRECPDRPWVRFGIRPAESEPGEGCVYWRFSTRGLEEVLRYAGFARARPQEPYRAPLTDGRTGMMHRAIVAHP